MTNDTMDTGAAQVPMEKAFDYTDKKSKNEDNSGMGHKKTTDKNFS